jgi:hypothetical protein
MAFSLDAFHSALGAALSIAATSSWRKVTASAFCSDLALTTRDTSGRQVQWYAFGDTHFPQTRREFHIRSFQTAGLAIIYHISMQGGKMATGKREPGRDAGQVHFRHGIPRWFHSMALFHMLLKVDAELDDVDVPGELRVPTAGNLDIVLYSHLALLQYRGMTGDASAFWPSQPGLLESTDSDER